jgi:hypothetical protein
MLHRVRFTHNSIHRLYRKSHSRMIDVQPFFPLFIESSIKTNKSPSFDLKNVVATAFTAATIASSAFTPIAQAADSYTASSLPYFGTSTVIAEKVIREGLYRDYEVDLVQQYDDPRSTFKEAKETKSKKGMFVIFT